MAQPDHPDHPQTGPDVTITIDNKTFTVHRGNITVSELKALGGVPAAYELEQIVNGTLTPLRDDGHVVLKGGELFVSHGSTSFATSWSLKLLIHGNGSRPYQTFSAR